MGAAYGITRIIVSLNAGQIDKKIALFQLCVRSFQNISLHVISNLIVIAILAC